MFLLILPFIFLYCYFLCCLFVVHTFSKSFLFLFCFAERKKGKSVTLTMSHYRVSICRPESPKNGARERPGKVTGRSGGALGGAQGDEDEKT